MYDPVVMALDQARQKGVYRRTPRGKRSSRSNRDQSSPRSNRDQPQPVPRLNDDQLDPVLHVIDRDGGLHDHGIPRSDLHDGGLRDDYR